MKSFKMLLIGVCLVLLSGCGADEYQIGKAQELCASHRGIKILYGTAISLDVIVLCEDGTLIDYQGGKNEMD